LDTILELNPGASKQQLLNAMKEHVLAEGTTFGVYDR
jgi:phosphatidylethanolamine-binding protein (PEBP) family uncharacterized protein